MDRDEHAGAGPPGRRGTLAELQRRTAFADENRPAEAGRAHLVQDLARKGQVELELWHASG
jgi:hypothetical protein